MTQKKYTATHKYETTSLPLFVSDLCLVSFPVVEYTHMSGLIFLN